MLPNEDRVPRSLVFDVEYSGILGVDFLKIMEAKVDLRTSTLVLGRNSHRL